TELSNSASGLCSTKPRSFATGPPSITGIREAAPSASATASCSNRPARFRFIGRLTTIPKAPSELCSQINVTVLLKFGSAMPGMAISSWLLNEPSISMPEVSTLLTPQTIAFRTGRKAGMRDREAPAGARHAGECDQLKRHSPRVPSGKPIQKPFAHPWFVGSYSAADELPGPLNCHL